MKFDLLQIGVFPAVAQQLIDAEFYCHSLNEVDSDEQLRTRIRGIVTRSNYPVPSEVIARLPALGIIATSGVGFDLIALDEASRRGIVVTNTPEVLNTAVAELCIGMLLALLRQIPSADRFVRAGSWRTQIYPLATSLAGKRVGIVGLGRIGKEIAKRLLPFGVDIVYSGRTDQQLEWPFEPDLLALARAADIVILTTPGGAATERMINGAFLDALGPQGFLVNMARGTVIDEDALIAALAERRIAGAALDVFDNEPDIDARFLQFDNVVLTPHVGSATNETRLAMAHLAIANLRGFLESGTTLTPVNSF